MSEEGFLRRWSRVKVETQQGGAPRAAAPAASRGASSAAQALAPVAQAAPHPPVAPPASPDAPPKAAPTLEDVAALTTESDFSAFVTQGVDKSVQRLAMKKLFSDPHFAVMDGLDIYIDDYTRSDPLPAAMLASLEHAKSVFAQFMNNEDKPAGVPPEVPGAAREPRQPPEDDA